MAETHQEVVKVWIAPGCIVCDACETDCPEVFDVQEETCVIRPPALKAEFTRPLTPSIKTAAEGCPVDVIKFETIEVEGPEPWAGKEAEAASVGAAEGAAKPAAAKKPAFAVGEGPPDPRWAGLLAAARTSGSRSAGGPPVEMDKRQSKAPAAAVAAILPQDAPPDALAAAMVGSGYARPRRTAVQRIREKAGAIAGAAAITRREFSISLAVGWGALAAVAGTAGVMFQSFMIPKVTKEPPSTFRAGRLNDFSEPGVYEQFKPNNVWIVHLPDGKLVALSTICTHLGCIPNWLPADSKFKCPCHGSGFYMDGVNFEGPAPRPLERLNISLDGEFIVIDKSRKYRSELAQWGQEGSELAV
jgi:cytochrome b6-f complex iron-sulfur subunit